MATSPEGRFPSSPEGLWALFTESASPADTVVQERFDGPRAFAFVFSLLFSLGFLYLLLPHDLAAAWYVVIVVVVIGCCGMIVAPRAGAAVVGRGASMARGAARGWKGTP